MILFNYIAALWCIVLASYFVREALFGKYKDRPLWVWTAISFLLFGSIVNIMVVIW